MSSSFVDLSAKADVTPSRLKQQIDDAEDQEAAINVRHISTALLLAHADQSRCSLGCLKMKGMTCYTIRNFKTRNKTMREQMD